MTKEFPLITTCRHCGRDEDGHAPPLPGGVRVCLPPYGNVAHSYPRGLTYEEVQLQLTNLSASFKVGVKVGIAQRKEIVELRAALKLAKVALINSADVLDIVLQSTDLVSDGKAEIAKWEAKCREAHAAIVELGEE